MGSNKVDLNEMIGNKYGKLTVIKIFYDEKRKRSKCLCLCDCGEETEVYPYSIKSGKIQSCGKCNFYSFEQWCIDNNLKQFLELWDYKLNDKKPSEISYGVRYNAFFKCPKEIHKSKSKLIYVVTRDKTISCEECSSFGQWCLDNDKEEWLELWDYELNNISPFEVAHASKSKYFFRCSKGLHESEAKNLTVIIRFKYLKCSKCNSVGQWMLDNLGDDALEKYLNYDYNKNNPFDINRGSKENVWIKCVDNDKHGIFQLKANSLTRGTMCPICAGKKVVKGINDITTTHPQLVKYFTNIEDAYKYSYGSTKKALMKCPDCGHQKLRIIAKLYTYGFCCEKCSDNIPYPEKFTFELLNQLKIKFKTQLNKKQFEWCDKYKYDFYFEYNNESYIIETHGMQHYEYGFNSYYLGKTTQEEQENDRIKKDLATSNGINHYITLDCRYSDLEWIKTSVFNSELPSLLNFKEEDVDWELCEKQALSSRMLDACRLWNEGVRDVKTIGKMIGIHFMNVTIYLKKCTKLNLCDYDPKIEKAKGLKNLKNNSKKVRVLEDDMTFDSIKNLVEYYESNKALKFHKDSISRACKSKKAYRNFHFEFVD